MGDPDLERFATVLVRKVRDQAIVACDRLAENYDSTPTDGRRGESSTRPGPREALASLIPDFVDTVLFELLNAIDISELPLLWRRHDGSCIPLDDLGLREMAGWYAGGPGGWVGRYSEQRWVDPLPGLRLREKPRLRLVASDEDETVDPSL